MPGVVLFLILCVFCPGSVYLSLDIGICSRINSTIKCCNNYKLNEKGTGCVECDLGYFGDCYTPCPTGRYGQLCDTICQCRAQQECHHVKGCVGGKVITKTSASKDGNCSNTSNECCLSYRKDNITNKCIACPNGWYNENCRDRCPYPYYGLLCGSKCDCSNETCNHVTGCNNSNSSNKTIDRESKETDSNLGPQTIWIIVGISVSVVIIVVVIGVICRCALSKSGIDYQPKHIQNSTRRQQASCENDRSVRGPCDAEQPLCHQEPECGTPSDFFNDNSENPYAQITDTARLMPRTKHTPKEVSIPKAPLFQSMSSSQCEETVPYDVLSLKIGSVSDLSSCDWSSPSAHWAKTCAPPPVVKNKPLPPSKRKSFLFPDDPSGYLEEKYVTGPSRSSEAEIKSLPKAPPPPTKIHQNGEIGSIKPAKKLPTPPKRTVTLVKKPDKVPRNPPRPPIKPSKDSSIYAGSSENGDPTIPNGSASVQNESTAKKKSKTAHFMPNTVLRREKSLKATLQKDALNKRKTNGKSYNLSGLLEVEDMPLPDFEEEEGGSGSQDHLQNEAPPTTVLRKCQTVLKNKMNRISALKFAGNPLRYSFARPQNS